MLSGTAVFAVLMAFCCEGAVGSGFGTGAAGDFAGDLVLPLARFEDVAFFAGGGDGEGDRAGAGDDLARGI